MISSFFSWKYSRPHKLMKSVEKETVNLTCRFHLQKSLKSLDFRMIKSRKLGQTLFYCKSLETIWLTPSYPPTHTKSLSISVQKIWVNCQVQCPDYFLTINILTPSSLPSLNFNVRIFMDNYSLLRTNSTPIESQFKWTTGSVPNIESENLWNRH